MANFELRLKSLKESWKEIQDMRLERDKARILARKYNQRVRELSQKIPQKLNEFNERMV